MDNGQINSAVKLAEEVLSYSRNTLLVNLRFLDMALSRFKMLPCDEYFIMTDGEYLLYNPKRVLKDFKTKKEISVRTYLHIVLHCVYRHMFMSPTLYRPLWNLACDIAVENVISEMDLRACDSGIDTCQKQYINDFKSDLGTLTAEKIYNYLRKKIFDEADVHKIRECFYADDHEIWYMTDEEKHDNYNTDENDSENNNTDENDSENNNTDENDGENNNIDENDSENNNTDENGNGSSKLSARAKLSDEWQKISERMQVDVETFGKERGLTPGDMLQNLREVNREKYDYTDFLKKFAVLSEAMKINDDEFDYIFYTYGLNLYDKMPLIEPLEYKEVRRIKEFVIAIDTSGSTSDDLVQTFLQKTYNILKSTESFHTKINLHIIQCDAEIQEDIKITSQDDFDKYIKTMKIRGLGGTDFKPVFTYVNKLIKNKEFTNLKGLIYFTDGCGDFPEKKPGYETAFVFIDDDCNNYNVPSWAIKLILKTDDIGGRNE